MAPEQEFSSQARTFILETDWANQPRQVKTTLENRNVPEQRTKRGMLWVDRVGNRHSWAILARNFSVKNGARHKKRRNRQKESRKTISKKIIEGRHVGLDFYDLLIEVLNRTRVLDRSGGGRG
jgi:hypothetical protein